MIPPGAELRSPQDIARLQNIRQAQARTQYQALTPQQKLQDLKTQANKIIEPLLGIDPQEVQDLQARKMLLQLIAFHGSPHIFERFDPAFIGTGEGHQMVGQGLYFAQAKGTAENYREALSDPYAIANAPPMPKISPYHASEALDMRGELEMMFRYAARPMLASDPAVRNSMIRASVERVENKVANWDALPAHLKTGAAGEDMTKLTNWYKTNVRPNLGNLPTAVREHGGALYTVDLNDEHIGNMLRWETPVAQQPEPVQRIAKAMAATQRMWNIDPQTQQWVGGRLADFWKLPVEEQDRLIAQTPKKELKQYLDLKGQTLYGMLATEEEDEIKNLAKVQGREVYPAGLKGQQIERYIRKLGENAASQRLNQMGVPGIKYADQLTRTGPEGEKTFNFVVFDPDKTVRNIHRRLGPPGSGRE